MNKRRFYAIETDPFGNLISHRKLDWQMARAGDCPGPYVAPHLADIGVKLKSLGSGFPREAPPDKIVYDFMEGLPLRDIEGGANFWIISAATRSLLQKFAAGSVDIVPANVFIRCKGEDREVPSRFLCDVVRFEDAVDEVASSINWRVSVPQYDPVGSKFSFRPELPAELHLFRLSKLPTMVVCSGELRNAIEAASLTGFVFQTIEG